MVISMGYRENLTTELNKLKDLNFDDEKILLAYDFAKEAHAGQFRKSGEAYIGHPVEVAKILMNMALDSDTIVAALLHDVVEDTMLTKADIAYNFGDTTANLVDGVTKLGNLPEGTKKQDENIRKMIVAMAKDVRVVIIKLADRLHNMRTLKFMKPAKQESIAKETLEVFAPLAHRLGIAKIKWELEDLCFYYLQPNVYRQIVELVNSKRIEREEYTEKVKTFLLDELGKVKIEGTISGRVKHFYSIYKKMYEKGKSFEELYDLTALRIIVKTLPDCYNVLGILHNVWIPVPGRFKDYIAVPKANGYQSIHTTVVGPEGKYVEIQIRTEDMHRIAEEGIAAHWNYKEKTKHDRKDNIYSWLRQILDWQKEVETSEEFIKTVTGDIFNETVFVFSPKGDVIELTKGSTPLDFAFHIHTQIGYKCIGAKVNGRMVPLEHELQNGDQVEIITSKSAKGPGNDWLKIVVTHSAKAKIKKWIKEKNYEENHRIGKTSIEKELAKINLKVKDIEEDERTTDFLRRNSMPNMDELYFHIGTGRIRHEGLLEKFKKKEEKIESIDEIIDKNLRKAKPEKSQNGIVIDGTDNTLVRFAKCCTPLPGDEVAGYVTRGAGITVHRTDCKNFISLREKDEDRVLEVNWDAKTVNNRAHKYEFQFSVICEDRQGMLMDIVSAMSEQKINLIGVNTNQFTQGTDRLVQLRLNVELSYKEQSKKLMNSISNIYGVIKVRR